MRDAVRRSALSLVVGVVLAAPAHANLVGPIDNIDARLKVSQSLFDPSGWARIGAARRGVEQAEADRTNSVELAAQGAAFAYLRAARAQAVVEARTSDLSLARD